MHSVKIGSLDVANDKPLTLIAGPCQMENREHALMTAQALKVMTDELGIGLIYKSSYDKANRSSITTERGIGMDQALDIFSEIKDKYGCPVITDVHEPWHCEKAAKVVDVIQIPAFLCRQTDLLVAAGETGAVINVKKGQFLAPWDMPNVVSKIESTGNKNIMLCERGASFGYNTLVSDMRSIPQLAATGYPVVYDATHSVQQPGGRGTTSGGQREFAPVLARAAISIGVAAVFIETHENPDTAPSDGPNMIPLHKLSAVLETLSAFDKLAKLNPINLGELS
ncbi:MAG: 3-deoxy-8-phosphooctulonate synthase [Rhodospirillales bacterium]|jgi:2-dehydro-3-deoxyphosphooctonate aldolase (KDO 8-P synthase)|nr:3-deoxy-8-phosphooctulonate synthase [Rhodospirillales bacterium]